MTEQNRARKIAQSDKKWEKFDERMRHRQKNSKVSPQKRAAIEKFDDIMGQLKRKRMLETGKTTFDLEATFRDIDESGDGSLNKVELATAMSRLGLPLDDKDLDDVLLVIDPDGSGEQAKIREAKMARTQAHIVDSEDRKRKKLEQKWENFNARMKARQQNKQVPSWKRAAIQLFDEVMTKLKKRQMKRTGKRTFDLEGTFREIDDSGDGELTQIGLQTAMEKLGVPLTREEISAVMMVVDADGSGSVDIGEFALIYYNRRKLVQGGVHTTGGGSKHYYKEQAQIRKKKIERTKAHLKAEDEIKRLKVELKTKKFDERMRHRQKNSKVSPQKRAAIEKFDDIMGQLKRKRMLETGKTTFDLEATFRDIDESGDGSLNKVELATAMSRLGLPLDDKDLDDVLLVIDPDGSGEVDIGEDKKQKKGNVLTENGSDWNSAKKEKSVKNNRK
eukprot:g6598.t1